MFMESQCQVNICYHTSMPNPVVTEHLYNPKTNIVIAFSFSLHKSKGLMFGLCSIWKCSAQHSQTWFLGFIFSTAPVFPSKSHLSKGPLLFLTYKQMSLLGGGVYPIFSHVHSKGSLTELHP